jgi:uncharacterized phage protein (TIGR01671 family)
MRGKEREGEGIKGEKCEMKQLKFRIWDKKYHMFDCNESPDLFISTDGEVYEKDERSYAMQTWIEYNKVDYYEVNQYTGIKDKSGQEIYEGDIVHFIRPDLPYVVRGDGYFDTDIDEGFQLKGEVKFLYGCWFIDEGDEKGCPLEFEKEQILEVIGNIYQNKELLK